MRVSGNRRLLSVPECEAEMSDTITLSESGDIFERTNSLRFIVRTVYPGGDMGHPERQRILQQAWQNRQTGEIDWRDVPTEIEE